MSPLPSLAPDVARRLSLALAGGRVALGVTALALPRLPLRPWVGDASGDRHVRLLARALGVRDVALGMGVILANRHDGPIRGWVEAGGMADAGDALVTAMYARSLPRVGRWLVLASAGGGALAARLASVGVDADASPGAGTIDAGPKAGTGSPDASAKPSSGGLVLGSGGVGAGESPATTGGDSAGTAGIDGGGPAGQ
jgi:hypothetical protein